jgi:hypothetical protein
VVQPPPDLHSVSRIEFDNIESVVRASADKLKANSEKLDRLQARVDGLVRDIAELTRVIRTLVPPRS